jgi:hypothetical protein
MTFFNGTSGKLQIINLVGFLSIFIFEYFDKITLGCGLALTLSGLLSLIAFAINVEPIYNFVSGKIIFTWLFEKYSDRALNLFFGIFFFLIGVAILSSELK